MALSEDKSTGPKATAARIPKSKKDVSNSDLGQALRSVYQRAIDEDVPAEMLDLLDKLG